MKPRRLPVLVRLLRAWIWLTHPKAEDCPIDECGVCAVRDCPNASDDHYWHDGCPSCWAYDTNGYRTGNRVEERH